MAVDRPGDEPAARVLASDARTSGSGLDRLPDLVALAAGIAGAAAFEDAARWLCGAGGLVALASLGARMARRPPVDRADPARSRRPLHALAPCLPGLLLLVGILHAAVSSGPDRTPFAAASTSSPPPTIRVDDAQPAARDCLANEAVKTYLDALYRHLDATWRARDDSAEGGFVVLGFLLDAEGGIRLSRVLDRSSDAYRDFGTATLSQAAPFGPLTPELACLGAIELRATLDRTSPH